MSPEELIHGKSLLSQYPNTALLEKQDRVNYYIEWHAWLKHHAEELITIYESYQRLEVDLLKINQVQRILKPIPLKQWLIEEAEKLDIKVETLRQHIIRKQHVGPRIFSRGKSGRTILVYPHIK